MTALERAQLAVREDLHKNIRELIVKGSLNYLFQTFVTWFDAQPAGSLEHFTDFPKYPECLGVTVRDGQGRWTIGKEPTRKEIPNPPIIAFFEYWGEEGKIDTLPPAYTESYLLYRDHIETGDANGRAIEIQGLFDDLANQISKIIETHPVGSPAQGKE